MKENRASSTAMGVAKVRAAHQLVDGEPLILTDPVVLRLVGQQAIEAIRADASLRADPRFAAFRAHIVLRNRYAEDCLMEAAGRNVRQYVLMGAGYDTFAYRQPPWAEGLRIFEVDHPASQTAKRELLSSAGVLLPQNLRFAAVNFESESLKDGLLRAGFSFTQPAFSRVWAFWFIWRKKPSGIYLNLQGPCNEGRRLYSRFRSRIRRWMRANWTFAPG